ncbi:MAG: hypothetical protein JHC33_10970 [Ignisphaera sp.]|nr:hypothetical protein [Ignisphaera sp.]
MNLNNLLNVLRGGNLALGQKLQNLLTEDCVILEYTDDAVLFHKNNHLVLAKFKHNLTESKMTAEDVLDNEVIYVSSSDTERKLKSSLMNMVNGLVEENYLSAESELATFCEQYYQYNMLKRRYPEIFSEKLEKKSKGLAVRQKAYKLIPSFRSDLFSLATMNESTMEDATEYVSVLETTGFVLALGKAKILPIVTDALLGNEQLAEQITNRLYEAALTLTEANEDLMKLVNSKYDLESGRYHDEDESDLKNETLDGDSEYPGEDEIDENEENEPGEFKEFDPSKLSDEEIKTLHVDILKSFLGAMSDFVSREAQNAENTSIDPDLDGKLQEDLDKLDDIAISDEELSRIEADWQPVLSFFLDSDLYKADQERGDDEVSLDDVVDGGEDADLADSGSVDEPVEGELPPGGEEVPVEGELPPPAPGEETEEEKAAKKPALQV